MARSAQACPLTSLILAILLFFVALSQLSLFAGIRHDSASSGGSQLAGSSSRASKDDVPLPEPNPESAQARASSRSRGPLSSSSALSSRVDEVPPQKRHRNKTRRGRRAAEAAGSTLSLPARHWQPKENSQAVSGEGDNPWELASSPPALPPCPAFLSSIAEDLEPWRRRGGISREALFNARQAGASLRLVIAGGRLFAEELQPCYQTRALFSLWGLLQLLRLYPGDIPDVELMLNCDDWPHVSKAEHALAAHPPLLLKFCSSTDHMDVPWPDWSFWGWAEVGLQQWGRAGRSIAQAGARLPWGGRRRAVQWKGAVWVAPELRGPVVQCRDGPREEGEEGGGEGRGEGGREHGGEGGETEEWGGATVGGNGVKDRKRDKHGQGVALPGETLSGQAAPALVDTSDTQWLREYNRSSTRLEGQCGFRYKLYVEGTSWSCSLKYILACGATPVFVAPRYYDFFSRALLPGVHYIPVPTPASCSSTAQFCQALRGVVAGGAGGQEEPCKSMEKGFEGNSHSVTSMGHGSAASATAERFAGAGICLNRTAEHERIAQEAFRFVSEALTMRHVYEFMRHFLVAYHRLQQFDALLAPRHGMRLVTEEGLRAEARSRSGEFDVERYLEGADADPGSTACDVDL